MSTANKKCSRCKLPIHCQADNISACDCYQVTISEDTVDYLKETKYNCLCNNCLEEVDILVQKAHASSAKMTEGVHYYIENGNLVFTELNHIKRGYCCGSGCRHCAYGS